MASAPAPAQVVECCTAASHADAIQRHGKHCQTVGTGAHVEPHRVEGLSIGHIVGSYDLQEAVPEVAATELHTNRSRTGRVLEGTHSDVCRMTNLLAPLSAKQSSVFSC